MAPGGVEEANPGEHLCVSTYRTSLERRALVHWLAFSPRSATVPMENFSHGSLHRLYCIVTCATRARSAVRGWRNSRQPVFKEVRTTGNNLAQNPGTHKSWRRAKLLTGWAHCIPLQSDRRQSVCSIDSVDSSLSAMMQCTTGTDTQCPTVFIYASWACNFTTLKLRRIAQASCKPSWPREPLTSCMGRMRRSATAVARVACVRSLAAGVKVDGAGGTPSRLGCRSTTVPAVDTAQHRSTCGCYLRLSPSLRGRTESGVALLNDKPGNSMTVLFAFVGRVHATMTVDLP